jgi:hypothetical protein
VTNEEKPQGGIQDEAPVEDSVAITLTGPDGKIKQQETNK